MGNHFETSGREGEIIEAEQGKNEAAEPKVDPEVMTADDFEKRIGNFNADKEATLTRMNEIRKELGMPETDEVPARITENEKILKSVAEQSGYDPEKVGHNEAKLKAGNVAEKEANTETQKAEEPKEKPLMPGDEVFSGGRYWRISDIHVRTEEELREKWDKEKITRDKEFNELTASLPYKEGSDNRFQEKKKFDEQKKKEFLENNEKVISAVLKNGQESIELSEKNAIRIDTPEQREKIKTMHKEQDDLEAKGAMMVGMGAEKKVVDAFIGHPGTDL